VGSYRLAPEWARQDAVILVWPHSNSDWNSQLNEIERTYIELSRYISRHQKLIIVAYDYAHIHHLQKTLNRNDIKLENIQIIDISTDDTWVRDFGPVFVKSEGESILLDFEFDAWGGKYIHEYDNLFNQTFKEKLNIHTLYHNVNFVLEAGNLEINSKGTALSSSACFNRELYTQNEPQSSLENKFEDWFGCNKVFWINDIKLVGDDTDGHIDTLARYCTDNIIAYSATGNNYDSNNDSLNSLANQLTIIKQNEPTILELVPLPLPKPIFNDGDQLPATYANFLVINEYVLVPVFNDKQDNYALKIIDDLFPSREIIDIESSALIQQFGGIHCATMQIPEGFL